MKRLNSSQVLAITNVLLFAGSTVQQADSITVKIVEAIYNSDSDSNYDVSTTGDIYKDAKVRIAIAAGKLNNEIKEAERLGLCIDLDIITAPGNKVSVNLSKIYKEF